MNPVDYILAESQRQSATQTEIVGMMWAYQVLRNWSTYGVMSESVIKDLSMMITGNEDYRLVPAVFAQGMPAVHAELIPSLMKNVVKGINEAPGFQGAKNTFINIVTKEFLDIHPFADGNGRVASLLYNWMRGTLDDPVMLPYYYGDN